MSKFSGHKQIELNFDLSRLQDEVTEFIRISKTEEIHFLGNGPHRKYYPLRGAFDDNYSLSFSDYRDQLLAKKVISHIESSYIEVLRVVPSMAELNEKELNLFIKELHGCDIRYLEPKDHKNFEHFPYFKSVLSSEGLLDCVRIDLATLGAKQRIKSHSHKIFFSGAVRINSPYEIIHVPVLHSESTEMIVEVGGIEQSRVYSPGESWVFDSTHPHQVINHGDEDRYNLMVYVNRRSLVGR